MTAVAVALGLAVALGPARAQPREPDRVEEARRHYDQGQMHFDLAEYDQAIDQFRKAYAISRAPLLLFNIGQAHRLRGDCAQAYRFYENYLTHAPDAHNRSLVEDLLDEMRACAAAERERPTPEPTGDGGGEAPAPETTDSAPATNAGPGMGAAPERATRSGTALRWSGVTSAGAGVALLATSGLFAARARSAARDVSAQCDTGCEWDDVAERDRAGRSAARTATITAAAGGSLVIGGAILYVLGRRADRPAPALSLSPSTGGGEVSVTWRF